MKTIIEEIKQSIRQHERIKKSPLNAITHWKQTQYIQLSDIISEEISKSPFIKGDRIYELGTSISYITLKRFFENSYRETAINDLRFLKTLHKLCIFLGYYDLNEFIIECHQLEPINTSEEQFNLFKNIIQNFCLNEFECIKNLPIVDISSLLPFAFKDCNLIKRTEAYLKDYNKSGYTFDHDYKQAKFELLDCKLISDNDELKVLKTHELWDMILKTETNNTFFYKVINYQTYFIKKENNQWKIWDNYNPKFNKIVKDYL